MNPPTLMFRAVVFAVLTFILSRELGDGAVPIPGAAGAPDVQTPEPVLADAALPAIDPVAIADEAFFVDPVIDGANDMLFASRLIPQEHLLIEFEEWTDENLPVFAGDHTAGAPEAQSSDPQTPAWSGRVSMLLGQAAGMKTRKSTASGLQTENPQSPASPGDEPSDETPPQPEQPQAEPEPEIQQPAVSVPEPGTAPLLAFGLIAFFLATRRTALARR